MQDFFNKIPDSQTIINLLNCEVFKNLAGYQLPVEIFKYLTIQAVDCCLVCGEFVKRNWHGESPCAEGQSATGVLSPTLILSVRVQVLILNSPGGTRHHAMAHSATLQPLSGGAFLWAKKKPEWVRATA